MVWVDSKFSLDYYFPKPWGCWCESLIFPSDLFLQGLLYNVTTSTTNLYFYVYSADGLTQYEDATSYFNWYFAKYGQQYFFNANLTAFSPAMCAHNCWVIRAVMTQNGITVFDKWTQRYCNTNCCNTASGFGFTQDNVVVVDPNTDDPNITIPDAPVNPAVNACGQQLIKLATWFSCVDNFNGNIFAEPTTIYTSSGDTNFTYTIVSTFRGRFVPRPRSIEREVSSNCRLQKVESAKNYLFEGYEFFPAWKMREIEGQLHADNIYIDNFTDVRYGQFTWDGGEPFDKVSGARDCDEVFKLSVNLRECIIRQFFGCVQDCDEQETYFIIPASYNGQSFYGESGELIATQYDGTTVSPAATGLLQWFRNQDGITSVTDIPVGGFDCDMYALFKVTGNGYIPSVLYFNFPIPRNKIYSVGLADVTSVCGYTGVNPCVMPVNGTIVIGDVSCDTPVNGTVVIGVSPTEDVGVNGYGSWTDNIGSHVAVVSGSQVAISLDATNTTFIGLAGENISFANEIFATVNAGARPLVNRVLDETNNGNIPSGMFITVGTDGSIAFSGSTTFSADNVVDLVFSNLVYDL